MIDLLSKCYWRAPWQTSIWHEPVFCRNQNSAPQGSKHYEIAHGSLLSGQMICTVITLGPFTLAKTKIQKTWVFWHEKRMREKTQISYLCFGKWCACATSLYLWPYTCSAHLYVAGPRSGDSAEGHVPKNPNNIGEIGASVYIGKKPVKFRRSFKISRCGGGFFNSVFFVCLGEVA